MTELSDPIVLKDIISTISPLIKTVVDTFVTPRLVSIKERFKLDYNKYHIPSEDHFSEYFHRTYKKLSILNTLVFNNSQRILKDVYVPLTIAENRDSTGIRIESCPTELINSYEKILITDTAGMGKSTLMKRIFLDIIDNKIGVPIFVELRRLNKNKTIIQEIHEQINSIDKEFDEQLLLEFIREGGFLFILDGYDEISLKDREVVTRDIQDFINKASSNKFLLTSRPENALTSFGDFKSFQIQPLKKKEAFELLRKYDKQGAISSLLIKKLGESHLTNIEEFLTNPLLVSLLFLAFQYKQTIPFKKYLFYRQVYDANFEAHDLTKGDSYTHDKYTNLEIDDFHRVMRHIGYQCLKEQKIEFTKDEILKIISNSKKFCVGIDFKESDFLNDLIITVPLFAQDGIYYKWAHKSLQEYFAAQFIYLDITDNKTDFLKSLYKHKEFDKFINILDLYYDMDLKSFRNTILYEFLKEYKEFYEHTCLCFDALVPEELKMTRKELCFNNKLILILNGSESDFLHKDMDEFVKKYVSKNNEFGKSFYSITIGGLTKDFSFMRLSEQHDTLKTILSRKKHEIIKHNNTASLKIDEHSDIIKLLIKDSFDKTFELTSCENNPFNRLENFQLGNDLIMFVKRGSPILDTVKAFSLLKEIESDFELFIDEELYKI